MDKIFPEKINNYLKKYDAIKNEIENLIFLANFKNYQFSKEDCICIRRDN